MGFYVYKITNTVNNKIYVGQTTDSLNTRFNRHKGYQLNMDYNSKLHRAMKKYGTDKFSIHLIEECKNQEELTKREYYWINKLNTINEGYNINNSGLKCGGDTLTNHPNKKEICKKISESKKGEKNPRSRKIKAIDIIDKKEYCFGSIMECVRTLNFSNHCCITKRANGKIKSLYKKRWLFNWMDDKKLNGNISNNKKIKAINIITKEIFKFNSIDECVRTLNLKTHSNVYKILNNKTDKPYKNTWLFEYL